MANDLKFNPDYAEEITAELEALTERFRKETLFLAPSMAQTDQDPQIQNMRHIMWQQFKHIRELEGRTVEHKPLEWESKIPTPCSSEVWESRQDWIDLIYQIDHLKLGIYVLNYYLSDNLCRIGSFDTKREAQDACQRHAQALLYKHIKECSA